MLIFLSLIKVNHSSDHLQDVVFEAEDQDLPELQSCRVLKEIPLSVDSQIACKIQTNDCFASDSHFAANRLLVWDSVQGACIQKACSLLMEYELLTSKGIHYVC